MKKSIILLILIIPFIVACSYNSDRNISSKFEDYLRVPSHFPKPEFPADNPYSKEKAELGRYLFYESLLVKDTGFPSCSHCMYQEAAFSNNVAFARGSNNMSQMRNNMSLANVVYRPLIFWDGHANKIERPSYGSLYMTDIFDSDTNEIVKRLEDSPLYPALFKAAFPDGKISAYNISLAIATFVRTMISGNSRYDQYLNGNKSALDAAELRGMDLFFSERCRCSVCHSGIMFTDMKAHNTGVTSHYFDRGRFWVTHNYKDRNAFLTPSLRNVEKTAPYMSDGWLVSLEEVIDHYNIGGQEFALKDTLMRPLNLNPQEKSDLIAFLKSLTDEEFLTDPRFSNPHRKLSHLKK